MSSTNGAGLVVIDFSKSHRFGSSTVVRPMKLTPPGRVLAAIYRFPREWKRSVSWDSLLNSAVLGSPETRNPGEDDWSSLGTLAVRSCDPTSLSRKIVEEFGVSLFVRRGDRAYSRKKLTTRQIQESSRINTLHPVFTRDVANNVWHVPIADPVGSIINRLSGLLTWSDEKSLIFQKGRLFVIAHKPIDLDDSLIGVPTKITYLWQEQD